MTGRRRLTMLFAALLAMAPASAAAVMMTEDLVVVVRGPFTPTGALLTYDLLAGPTLSALDPVGELVMDSVFLGHMISLQQLTSIDLAETFFPDRHTFGGVAQLDLEGGWLGGEAATVLGDQGPRLVFFPEGVYMHHAPDGARQFGVFAIRPATTVASVPWTPGGLLFAASGVILWWRREATREK